MGGWSWGICEVRQKTTSKIGISVIPRKENSTHPSLCRLGPSPGSPTITAGYLFMVSLIVLSSLKQT